MSHSVFVSRSQYNWLVERYQHSMKNGFWQRLRRSWSLAGITVTGAAADIRELFESLGRHDLAATVR